MAGKQGKTVNVPLDPVTGKVSGLILEQGKKLSQQEPYAMVFLGALRACSKNKAFKLNDLQVRDFIISEMQYGNEYVHLTHARIAEELEIPRSVVSRSMGKLIKANILIKGARVGNGHIYFFNPELAWRGSMERREEVRTEKSIPCLQLVPQCERRAS